MRQAAKMLKDILREKYPNNEFYFKYHKTKDEMEMCDKLVVLCEKVSDLEQVASHIKKYVSGIVVFKEGERVPPINRDVGRIVSVASYNWVEAASLEYIEIKYVK